MTLNAPLISTTRNTASRSTVFLNITAKYVDAAAARVGDMLLPSDDRAWGLKAPPIPEFTQQIQKQMLAQGVDPNGIEILAQQRDDEVARATKQAERAEQRIDGWLIEAQWHAQARGAIDDAAKLGTGILKGPFPIKRKETVYQNGQLVVSETLKPTSKRIDPWNFYPDPHCGESIQDGEFVWERGDITAKTLRSLQGTPGYIDEQIERCLREGPQRPQIADTQRSEDRVTPETTFEIWYYYGFLSSEDLHTVGCDCEGRESMAIPAIITIVNEHVIKAALNPLDTGSFPYDLMVWQEREDMPWGIGVAKQVDTPQRMINAGSRNMMDNAGLSAGPQIVMFQNVVRPVDGKYELTPRKFWIADPNADIRQVEHAFISINIESRQQDLMAIIEFALRMAEEVTGMPMLLQGQQGSASETLGGMNMLNNNANSVLRRIARTFDFRVTEPHIERYYDWLMAYGEDDSEKGLFVVDARGSSVLVERDIQNQAIMQLAQLALNPQSGTDVRKFATEAYKSQHLDPRRFQYNEEDWKKMQQQAQQQPPDPAIAIAQMKIEAEQARAQFDEKLAQLKMAHETEKAQIAADTAIQIGEMKRQAALLNTMGQREIATDDVKGGLAKALMSERNKAAIADAELQVEKIKAENPPTPAK